MSDKRRFRFSPRAVLVVLAALCALAADAWRDWRAAQGQAEARPDAHRASGDVPQGAGRAPSP